MQVTGRLAAAQGGEGGEGGEGGKAGGKRSMHQMLATAKGAAKGVSANWQLALTPGAAARRDFDLGEGREGRGAEDGATQPSKLAVARRNSLEYDGSPNAAAMAAAAAASTPKARLRAKAQQV